MLENVLSDIKEKAYGYVDAILHGMKRHQDSAEKVRNFFSDEESKEAYDRELRRIFLRHLFGSDKGHELAGSMSKQEWRAAVLQANAMVEEGTIPRLEHNIPEGHHSETYLYAPTFVIEQYRYKDIVSLQKNDIFLDCGACFGETALWALSKGAKKVYSFEPDPFTRNFTEKNLASQIKEQKATIVPCALGSEAGELPFRHNPSSPAASSCHPDGNVSVPIISLDDWSKESNVIPTYIKMDLEGAEINALEGARQLIRKHKPRLAIALYHKIADMWRIPLLIKEIYPDYHFWCRQCAYQGEFILYAKDSNA